MFNIIIFSNSIFKLFKMLRYKKISHILNKKNKVKKNKLLF